jgi:hypothetical protein
MKLDNTAADAAIPYSGDGWKQASVIVNVPTGDRDLSGDEKPFAVTGLHFRPLTKVITFVFADPRSRPFHLAPFKRFFTKNMYMMSYIHWMRGWRRMTGSNTNQHQEKDKIFFKAFLTLFDLL